MGAPIIPVQMREHQAVENEMKPLVLSQIKLNSSAKEVIKPALIAVTAAFVLMLVVAPQTANATADGCAVVLKTKTPDGFLNVRKAPTANAEIVAKLKQGDVLDVDTAQCETRADLSICSEGTSWTHVTSIRRLDGKQSTAPTQGWVRDRYVKWFTCEEDR